MPEFPRVLLVEDNPLELEDLCNELRGSSVILRCAASAEEALEQLSNFVPHVLVTDYQMGAMDGAGLVQLASQGRGTTMNLMRTVRLQGSRGHLAHSPLGLPADRSQV